MDGTRPGCDSQEFPERGTPVAAASIVGERPFTAYLKAFPDTTPAFFRSLLRSEGRRGMKFHFPPGEPTLSLRSLPRRE
jgi:hypothetical protein